MKQYVLIFSIKEDPHADRVQSLLGVNKVAVRLNLDDPGVWSLNFRNGDVIVDTGIDHIGLNDINSVFVRRIPSIESYRAIVPEAYGEYRDYIAQQRFSLFSDCLSILDHSVLFVNPLASSSNLSKAKQQFVAESLGLKTPATYIGSDASDVKAMASRIFAAGGEMCTKPVSSAKILINGELSTRFTEKFDAEELNHLDTLAYCPIIFQEYTNKKFEVRGTIVGSKIFAARIESQQGGASTAVDWRRYNIPKTPHYPHELPSEISEKLIKLHKELKVHAGSFDLIFTTEGEYVFLETNPYGQWLWIEELTGLQISREIAAFLSRDA